MSQVEIYAASAGTPASGTTKRASVIAPGNTTDWLTTPADWLGKYVRWTFVGAAPTDVCYVRFSATTAPTVSLTATVVASNVLAASAAEPDLVLPNGVPVDDILDKRFLFFAFIASAASGKLYVQLKTFGFDSTTSA